MRVVSRPTETGRVSLRNQTLTRLVSGDSTEERIPEGAATMRFLAEELL